MYLKSHRHRTGGPEAETNVEALEMGRGSTVEFSKLHHLYYVFIELYALKIYFLFIRSLKIHIFIFTNIVAYCR